MKHRIRDNTALLRTLRQELFAAQQDLSIAYRQFNQAVDPDLVDSCVYRINSLNARCNYLLRTIKSCDPEALASLQAEGGIPWT